MSIPKILPYSLIDAIPDVRNKVNWNVDPAKAVLLIHDVQNYFMNFYGKDSEPVTTLVKNIIELKRLCKKNGIPVVYTAQPANQSLEDRALLTDFWGPGLSDENRNTEIIPELVPDIDDLVYTKWRYSAFQRTDLQTMMKTEKRDQLLICGVYAHIGILATSLEAFMNDIKPFVVSDAVADFSMKEQADALVYISQRCGTVLNYENVREHVESNLKINLQLGEPKITLEAMKKDIANILNMPTSEIESHDNLIFHGLDSLRLMKLVEGWRAQGVDVLFEDLAEVTTVAEWFEIIQSQSTVTV